MKKYIIHPQENGSIMLLMPSDQFPIEEVARKDVPSGVPYKIVDESYLPSDHTFFNAWEDDFSEPDGFGIGHEAWFAEQEALRQEAENDSNQPE